MASMQICEMIAASDNAMKEFCVDTELRNGVVFVDCKRSALLQRETSIWLTLVATNKERIKIWFDDES